MRTSHADSALIAGRELFLRQTILAVPILVAPVVPAAVLGWQVVWVVFTILASVDGGIVVLFYGLWAINVILEGAHTGLIGDDTYNPCRLYWPWGPHQKHIRRVRKIRELERACGVSDAYPIGWPL